MDQENFKAISTTGEELRIHPKTKHQFAIDQFIKNCEQKNKARRTIINYKSDLLTFTHWVETQGPKKLNAVKVGHISDYLEVLRKGLSPSQEIRPNLFQFLLIKLMSFLKFFGLQFGPFMARVRYIPPLSVSSRKRHLSSLVNFYEFLVQSNTGKDFKSYKRNPVRPKLHNIRLKDTDIDHTQILKEEHWRALDLKTMRIEDRLLILLMYRWGLRLHEVANLRFEYFAPESKSITFPRKGGKLHTLRPTHWDQVYSLIKLLLARGRGPRGPIYYNSTTKRKITERTLFTRLKKMLKKSGLNEKTIATLGPHSFRKACATNLYLLTKDLLLVRDYLNHSDAKVTQTYIDKAVLEEHRPEWWDRDEKTFH